MSGSQPGDIFQPGDLLNNTYRIESMLGRGGTSEVYKARSEISGRVIAVKALRAEYAQNEDFLVLMTREEEIRDVRHDAVVRYYDTQRMPDGVVYLAMDFVDGTRLDKMASNGGLPAKDLMVIGQRVAEGLVAAHGHNIVHRDLSPDNIILRNDLPHEAVIIDFGIAKDTNPGAQTIVGNEFAGKYAYAAPEQLNGKTDARSDLYSLGALLLAAFRGARPDLGSNPMEMLTIKGQPLNLDGVPEPLAGIIARMSDPDPDKRFSSAMEVVAAFQDPATMLTSVAGSASLTPDVDTEATVVVSPPPAKDDAKSARGKAGKPAQSKPTGAKPTGAKSGGTKSGGAKPENTAAKKGSGALVPIIGVVAVAAIGAGGYFAGLFDGLLGPRYPTADPYAIIIQKGPTGRAVASGSVPSPEVLEALSGQMQALGGTTQLELASGNIPEVWGESVLGMVDSVVGLEEFRIEIVDDVAEVFGLGLTEDELDQARAAITSSAAPAFGISTDMVLGPRFLPANFLVPILVSNSDCGPLSLRAPPPTGYGLDDQIVVTGRLASEETRQKLNRELSNLAGDRPVMIDTEMLNDALCQIDAVLPSSAGPGGFELEFSNGDEGSPNADAVYSVGDNPVIDLVLPPDVQSGYLRVSIIDVKGLVFHLLPNLFRPENSVEALRADFPDGVIRLSYGLQEAQGQNRLAFAVDDSVLGKNQIIVMHTDAPLFDELRPTTESAAAYADALVDARNSGNISIRAIDTAILTTQR